MEDFFDVSKQPRYAILSHRWGDKSEELTLQELLTPTPDIFNKSGFRKVREASKTALSRGLSHIWVDTCCIDKTSSSELTEAINSMYAWYAGAEVCYVYLHDLPAPKNLTDMTMDVELLAKCDWFTRGWTLQELIAPCKVLFFDQDWNERGSKKELSAAISDITGIPVDLLNDPDLLSDYSVAQRMSWAASRQTTKPEDKSYCLLGIFDVHMSLIYGEGMKAFTRLQEVVLQKTSDLSIFVWTDDEPRKYAPLLADKPRQFKSSGSVEAVLEDTMYRDLLITSRGIRITVSLIHMPEENNEACLTIMEVFCRKDGHDIGISLRKISGGRYVRFDTGLIILPRVKKWERSRMLLETIHLPVSLPRRFLFDKEDPVLGNRHTVLKFRLCDSNPGFTLSHYGRQVPRSHWDVHDQVFFCSNTRSVSWGVLFVHSQLRPKNTDEDGFIPVNLFVGCHRWNLKRPYVYVCGLDDMPSEKSMAMETQLDQMAFESCRQAETVIRCMIGEKIERRSIVVETGMASAADVEAGVPKIPIGWYGFGEVRRGGEKEIAVPGWHTKFKHSGRTVWVRINVEVDDKEWDRTLCVANPITRVDVQFEVLEKPPAQKDD
ncbi:putative vegetative incompatibility protein [Podospora fimiseda]|uniref:Vegetative incompatibility protein n=1 Tax=Podospora fimiseda TaxID=252190 RepID=A0AAN7BHA8_9PEZI|nr:putative vegetative incompatibility protein [Podospora fimiseda]